MHRCMGPCHWSTDGQTETGLHYPLPVVTAKEEVKNETSEDI